MQYEGKHLNSLTDFKPKGPIPAQDAILKKPDFATSQFFINLLNALLAQKILMQAQQQVTTEEGMN